MFQIKKTRDDTDLGSLTLEDFIKARAMGINIICLFSLAGILWKAP
jgi:hypothetical protein